MLEIPGYQLAYKEWGPKDGRPVLALHGWLDNAASFDFLAPLLLPDLHIVAVDTPGCGQSSHPPLGHLPTALDEVIMMFHAAKALGWDRFILLGHSRGGVVANWMAAVAPEKVERLVLLDSIGSRFLSPDDHVQNLRKAVANHLAYKTRKPTIYPDLEAAADSRMNGFPLNKESARALAIRGTEPLAGGVTWMHDRRIQHMRNLSYPTQDQVEAMLKAIGCPTCLIMASEGLKQFEAQLTNWTRLVPSIEVHNVEGRHHVHMDNPGSVAPIINQFLK